tara:strand:+ start:335 stop:526 length:192 start_codon:yes stop_codon:yes gene_type:complete
MNNNANEPKQLDSTLHCKATANLESDVANDLNLKDKSLAELLEGKELDDTEDDTDGCNRAGET